MSKSRILQYNSIIIFITQCWDNQLSVEVPNGPLCNATIGLYCDWLCSDYSIRVACCEESESEPELDREIRYDLPNGTDAGIYRAYSHKRQKKIKN